MAKINWNDEQIKIIGHKTGNMIVSASAGSGKTTVMLERVLHLVEQGTPIERIVILAFNTAIASEIRGKIYKKLMQRIEDESCQNAVFLAEQIDRLPFCNIVTNDAFCNKTTREFFQILGVDPAVDIIAEKESNLYFENSYQRALEQLKEGEDDWIFDLTLKFGGEDGLFEQVKKIHNYVATSANGEKWLEKVFAGVYTDNIENSTAMQYLFGLVETRLDYCINCTKNIVEVFANYDEPHEKYSQFVEFFKKLKQTKNYSDFYNLINAFELAPKERKSKKYDIDWDLLKINHDGLKECLEWISTMFSEPLSVVELVHKSTIKDVKALINLYGLTEQKFRQEKQKNNKFNFTDFTENTLKLLNNPDIQQELSKRYDFICVDEYQDTNYAQEEIYTKLSNGNNLFMVGDSKQSIYRFRLSEPNILLNKFDDYQKNQANGTTCKLAFNYRSDSGVVDFVNCIFNEIMTAQFGGINYRKDDQLQYGADYKIGPTNPVASIDIFVGETEQKKQVKTFDEVYSVKDDHGEDIVSESYKEGTHIAKKIKEILASYKIYDTEIKATRAVKPSDIALLARSSNSSVKQIIKAVQENGIPVDIAPLLKDNEIYEVEIIKEFLKLINNDMQDYSLCAVLCSFWVGMDYDDLMKIRGNHLDAEYFYQAAAQEVVENKYILKLEQMLTELRIKSSFMSVKQLAEHLVYDFGYDKYVLSVENGDYKMLAVKTYLQSLDELSIDCSLSDYVNCLSEERMEIKGASGDNMIRAMTIHKSKGLEFPIVFLCNIEDSINKSKGLNSPKMQINKDVGIAINYFDEENMLAKPNLVFKTLTEYNKLEEKAEAMRVFYVALTRAKNHIFLSGVQKTKELTAKSPFKVDSFLDWIIAAAQNNEKIENLIEKHEEKFDGERVMQRYSFKKYEGEDIAEIDEYLNFEYPYKNSTTTSIKYSVTEINEINSYEDEIVRSSLSVFDEQDMFVNKAQRGTNYHAILEHIDYNATTIPAVQNELAKLVERGVLTEQDLAQIDEKEILGVLQSSVIEYARQNKHFREREFMLYVKACDVMPNGTDDKILVQGAVDLVINGEKLVVVDFKKSKADEKTLKNRYQKQIELYCMAVEGALGRKVDHAVLYVIGSNKIIKMK